jgi:hypothetical protein
MNVDTLLSTAAFGPTLWFAHLLYAENTAIESFENYQKQSFRNRYEILSANGRHSLVIPVDHAYINERRITTVKIAYSSRWQNVHLKAIISAYRNAPYFEFYFDEVESLLGRKLNSLFEFNMNATQLGINAMKSKMLPASSSSYLAEEHPGLHDLRSLIHPKRQKEIADLYHFPEYQQVFSERHGFQANLSILDMLFNLGPESADYLAAIVKKN